MNKKEVSEIKRQFKFGNKALAINGIAVYYIKKDAIESSCLKKFADLEDLEGGKSGVSTWDELEEVCFLDIIKKTFSGQIGKALCEYSFPNDVMLKTDGHYAALTKLTHSFTKEVLDNYINYIIEKLEFTDEYAIVVSNSSYSIPKKDVNGEKMDDEFYDGDTHDFLTFSFCLIENSKASLCVNKSNDIEHEPIQKQVTVPFLGYSFPVFNERMTDVNSVLTYNKKPKEPNLSLIESVLECQYKLNPDVEKDKFNNLLKRLASKDSETVDYEITKNIHQQISNIIENTSVNTEMTEFSKEEIKKILDSCGIEASNMEKFDEIFEEEVGDYKLAAVNLVESKMDIKSPDIVVNVKNDSIDKVNSSIIDGRRCLVIELDENVEINGLNVSIKKSDKND